MSRNRFYAPHIEDPDPPMKDLSPAELKHFGKKARELLAKHDRERAAARKIADHIDGYDRDDLGESPDY